MEKYNLLKNKENNKSTEVLVKVRRNYTASYKKKVIEEASKCSKPGELGALLRREGLSSSTLHSWRLTLASKGNLTGSKSLKRGPEVLLSGSQKERLLRLEKENYALKRKLEKANAMMELQKKIVEILIPDEEERI